MGSSVLLLGEPYEVKTIMFHLDYLLNFPIETAVVLRENHNMGDFKKERYRFRVMLADTLDEGMKLCDVCLVLKSNDRINYALRGKECNNIEIVTLDEMNAFSTKSRFNASVKPVILLISTDQFNQKYCTEILLNRLFIEHGIDIFQAPSLKTQRVFLKLSQRGMLNSKISDSMLSDGQVAIITLEHNFLEFDSESADFFTEFVSTKPDFVLLNKNMRTEFFPQIFKTRFGKAVDYIVESEYVPTYFWNNLSIPLFCGNGSCAFAKEQTNENCSSISDPFLSELLYKNILTAISVPDTVQYV